MAKPEKQKQDKTEKKQRKKAEDIRKELADRLHSLASKVERVIKRYFAGSQEVLEQAHKSLVAGKAMAEALPPEWQPAKKAKRNKKPIVGDYVMISPALSKDRLMQYNRRGGVDHFLKARITEEWNARAWMVELASGEKTILDKKDIVRMEV